MHVTEAPDLTLVCSCDYEAIPYRLWVEIQEDAEQEGRP